MALRHLQACVVALASTSCVGQPPSAPEGQSADGTETTSSSSGSTTAEPPGSTGIATSSASGGVTTDSRSSSSDGADAGSTGGSTGPLVGTTSVESTGPSASDGSMPASCDDIFGTAPMYFLCDSDEMSCSFNVELAGASCTELCAVFGEVCLGAIDNPGPAGDPCLVQGRYTCDATTKDTTICICTR